VSDGFQFSGERRTGLGLICDGQPIEATLHWKRPWPEVEIPALGYRGSARVDESWSYAGRAFDFEDGWVFEAGDDVLAVRHGRQVRVALHDPFAVDLEHMDEGGAVTAPMHGKLVAVFVKPGQRVEKGERLAIVEAMKMEHALVAPAAGEVAEVAAEAGAQVAEGARLIVIKTDDEAGG
jgi:3-methylcrotonyl-CoA carboxylase alpha subunit